MNWQEYEHACARKWMQDHPKDAAGVSQKYAGGADGGMDLVIRSNGEFMIGQCKHWYDDQVGVRLMREFKGVMASRGIKRGVFYTSSRFTPQAWAFGKENNIWMQVYKV